MFYNPTFMALMGSVPPVVAPVEPQIALAPANPGDLGVAPQNWTTEIQTQALTQVKYLVGINGAKTIAFAYGAPNATTVAGYNHGDTINFTGYGTSFTLTKDPSGPYAFRAQGSNGFTVFTIGTETRVIDVRYTIDGAGGTGPVAYTLLDLTDNKASLTVQFARPGDTLVVKSVDETVSAISGAVLFSGNTVRSISMTPKNPGDLLTYPKTWTTRVNVTGLTQVQWIVLDHNWVAKGNFVVVNVVNNVVEITPTFNTTGERLVVKSLDNTVEDVSGQVSFSQVARTITLNPSAPGNLGVAPKSWVTTVTAVNMPQVKWAIYSPANVPIGNWTVRNIWNNSASITATFTETGQKLVVRSTDDAIESASATVTLSVPAQADIDLQFVKDYAKDLTVGINIERGAGSNLSQAYFTELKADSNATHIRFFIPSKVDWGFASQTSVNNFLNSMAAAIAAGFKVWIGFTDVIGEVDVNNSQMRPYLTMCAQEAQKRNFDPRKCFFHPWNEFIGVTNAYVNPLRVEFTKLFRDILGPNYIIGNSASDWGNPDRTTEGTLSILADKRTIYEWHVYQWDVDNQTAVNNLGTKMDNFAANNNIVLINGEYGKGGTGSTDPVHIPMVINNTSRGIWRQRPSYWTITTGTHFRMNRTDSLRLTPEIATALREANTYIRAQAGWGT